MNDTDYSKRNRTAGFNEKFNTKRCRLLETEVTCWKARKRHNNSVIGQGFPPSQEGQ